jgi:hypothetical protein
MQSIKITSFNHISARASGVAGTSRRKDFAAAQVAAGEQEIPGHGETIEYEDDKGNKNFLKD